MNFFCNELRPNIELVSKAYRNTFLRSYEFGESPCSFTSKCEGMLHSIILPEFETESGKRFHGLCVLCLDRMVTEKWLSYCLIEEPCNMIIQPYYVDVHVDYDIDAMLGPVRPDIVSQGVFHGILLPYPRYKSYCIQKQGDGKLIQLHTDKRRVLYRNIEVDVLGARYFPFTDWQSNLIHYPQHVLELLYNGDQRIGLDLMYDFSWAVLLCPLLCNIERKNLSEIASLFRMCMPKKNTNSKVIQIENLSKETISFLQKCRRATLSGIYLHCSYTCPVEKLNECVLAGMNCEQLPYLNVICLREALIWFIDQDVVLFSYIQKHVKKYLEFKSTIIEECNRIRKEWVKTNNILIPEEKEKAYLFNTQRLSFWLFITQMAKKMINYENIKNKKRTPIDLPEYGIVLKQELIDTCMELKVLYDSRASTVDIQKKLLLHPNIIVLFTNLYDYFHNPKVILPKFVCTPIKNNYYCSLCRRIKCVVVPSIAEQIKLKMKIKHIAGQRDVILDIETKQCLCFTKKLNGRFKTEQCNQVCNSIQFGNYLIHMDRIAYINCLKCNRVCRFQAERMLNGFNCTLCTSNEVVVKCHICKKIKTKNSEINWSFVNVITDGGFSPCEKIWVCKKHTYSFFKTKSLCSLPELDEMIAQQRIHDLDKSKQRQANRVS
jgi:hypothetical protein